MTVVGTAVTAIALALPGGFADSTSYCLTSETASGTYSVPGTVAMNGYPFGTKIWARGPYGRRRWVVRDHPDQFTQLDFWVPSCWKARHWGRKTVRYRVGWRHKVGRIVHKREAL